MAITKKPCIHAALIILLFSLFVSASSQTTGPGPKKPNVVFILVDNTGWGDFSVYGGTTATPRIDKLASEGIRFNNCTSYPLFNDMVKEVLARQRVPELLDQPPQILEDGRESPPGQLALDMKVRPIVDGEYLIPKTIEFIQRQAAAKKPLFVDLGYSEMHPPSVCNSEFVNKSRGGIYSEGIAEMDYRIGQVLDAIKQAGHRG